MPRTIVNPVETKYRHFNDWVRGELKRRHMSQSKLAVYLNIGRTTLTGRLNGQIEWPFRDVLEVFWFFGVSVGEIL